MNAMAMTLGIWIAAASLTTIAAHAVRDGKVQHIDLPLVD